MKKIFFFITLVLFSTPAFAGYKTTYNFQTGKLDYVGVKSVSGDIGTLSGECAINQILKYDGTKFTCQVDSTSAGGGAVTVSEDGVFLVSADTVDFTTGIKAISLAAGRATVSGDMATTTAPGIASFNTTYFSIGNSGGGVSLKTVPVSTGGTGQTALSGTGFYHVNNGAFDTAARSVNLASADVTGTVPIGNGGLGITTAPNNGFFPIGNAGVYAVGHIASGTNITVAESAGGISIATLASGTVTSVATDATLTGGPITTTGTLGIANNVALPGSPTTTTQTVNDNSTKIATTAYVDTSILGQNYKEAVKYASTAALPSIVYSSGAGTLTGVALAAISLDGSSPAVADRVLIKNQASSFQNGIYTVTATGSGIAVFVLTRASDSNTSAEFKTGDAVFVTSGSTLSSTTWAYTGIDSPNFTSDAMPYVQIAGQGSFTAGTGINITGTVVSGVMTTTTSPGIASFDSTYFTIGPSNGGVSLKTVPVNTGGTGITTSPNNGYLLIGNAGAYASAALASGSGTTITNGAGSITIQSNAPPAQNLLNGVSHADTIAGAATRGSFIAGNLNSKWGVVPLGVSGKYIRSNGTDVSYDNLNVSDAQAGITQVSFGGTGVTTNPGNGQVLIGTGNGYVAANLTSGSGTSITNAAGAITIQSNAPPAANLLNGVSAADTIAGAATRGNLIVGNQSAKWSVMPISGSGSYVRSNGTDVSWNVLNVSDATSGILTTVNGGTSTSASPGHGQILIGTGNGYVVASITSGTGTSITNASGSITVKSNAPPAMNLLDGVSHADTIAGSATRGNLITGNLNAKWGVMPISSSGFYVRSNGTDVSWNTLNVSDATSGILTTVNGGTSVSTNPGHGQILIGTGNGYVVGKITSGSDVSVVNGAGSITVNAADNIRYVGLGFTIDGGGSVITTGSKGYLQVPYGVTLSGWTLLGDVSGSASLDVTRATFANFPTFTSIDGTTIAPRLISERKSTDTTVAGWTTSITSGDIIQVSVDSATTVTRLNFSLNGYKT